MSEKGQKNVKSEPAVCSTVDVMESEPESTVAANVTIHSANTALPLVIMPATDSNVVTSQQAATPPTQANAIQALLGALQGQTSGGLNITDYINAFVGQATVQENKTVLAPTALPLSSLPVARSLQSLQGIPTLSNAVESLFSLAPPSPAMNIGAVKQEQSKGSTTLKRRSSSSSSTAQENVASLSAQSLQSLESMDNDDAPASPGSVSTYAESGASGFKRRRGQPTRPRDEKLVCLVCGDKALGCNFDAVSCESCKAFFRRNALKEKKGKCLFDGMCKIDVNTRRFCPFCRLEKCFAVGMKKEFILSEDAKRKRVNRSKDSVTSIAATSPPQQDDAIASAPTAASTPLTSPFSPEPPSSTSSNTVAAAAAVSTPTPLQLLSAAAPGLAALAPNAGIQAMISSMTPQVASYTLPPTPAVPAAPTQITLEIPAGSTESVNLLSLSRFVKTTENFSVPIDSYLVRRLTVEESSMLQELMQIYDLSFTVDLEPLVHIKQVDPSLNQLVNQSSITVLRIIKFAKRLEEFVRLPQECQIGILKGCWIHMLLLRSVSAYDNERDLWVTPRGEIPTDILKNATGFDRLHDLHVKYCKSIRSIIKDDLTIVVLLIVTALFAPEGPHVITRELVSNIQDKYLVLLKHYLESKYMYGRAAEMFPQLMSKMKELKELAEDHGKYLLDVNPNEIEPIMLEILDLK